jgi:isopenicillin-N epimerase
MASLRELFLLDPDIVFLNHGSFGATPRPVFRAYQRWQRELERQPVRFLNRELKDRLAQARGVLAQFLGADPADLLFVPNATFGVNLVARSLGLGAGDEVLTTDHEYGACCNAWEFACRKTGAAYVRRPIPLPVTTAEEVVEQFWGGVTPRTRVIFLSHITSPTALRLPVEAICTRAREAGILTLVDGAHAPGQIPLDLAAVGADCYVGNLHKWMMSPKGAAFLHVRPERQGLMEPLVVSWGWQEDPAVSTGRRFPDALQWTGTMDPAAYLAVPAAIRFRTEHDWPTVIEGCHELLCQALRRVRDLTGLEPLYPDHAGWYRQMAAVPLPPIPDLSQFQARLYDEFWVEVPCLPWGERQLLRISVQGYNTQEDIDALVEALAALLPQVRGS